VSARVQGFTVGAAALAWRYWKQRKQIKVAQF
jgi:hypothetical protein